MESREKDAQALEQRTLQEQELRAMLRVSEEEIRAHTRYHVEVHRRLGRNTVTAQRMTSIQKIVDFLPT